MASYDTIYEFCLALCGYNVGTYSETHTIHGVSLGFHIYKVADNTALTSNIFTLCTAEDCATQVIVGSNLSVASGVTLLPPYRCNGILIFNIGTFTNNGVISMTARGSNNPGVDIYLYKNEDNTYEFVPAVGALGAEGHPTHASGMWGWHWSEAAWKKGIDGVNRQTGGGGQGCDSHGDNDWTCWVTRERAGSGTSFSGGAGTGGIDINSRGWNITIKTPTITEGGDAYAARWSSGWYNRNGGGGAGNPGGTGRWASRLGWAGEAIMGENGTGGLIIVFSPQYAGNGSFVAKGCLGGSANAHGGSSGGGSINLFFSNLPSSVNCNADGGTSRTGGQGGPSGAGGKGCITISQYTSSLLLYKDNDTIKTYKQGYWEDL